MFNFTFRDVATLCVEKCSHVLAHFQFEYAVEGNGHQYSNRQLFTVVVIKENALMSYPVIYKGNFGSYSNK
jgi:hypothetical protein